MCLAIPAQVVELSRELVAARQQLDWFKRQIFGQKSEKRIVAGEDGLGAGAVQTDRLGQFGQQRVRRHVFSAAVAGLEQSFLQSRLLARSALHLGPVQQPVGVEGVPDTAAPFALELEAHFGPPLADGFADLGLLLGCGAVFFRQVLAGVLPFSAHVGVQLERLEVDVSGHFALQLVQGLLQRTQTHGTPGAGHVGHKIDFERSRHSSMVSRRVGPCSQSGGQDPDGAGALNDNVDTEPPLFRHTRP